MADLDKIVEQLSGSPFSKLLIWSKNWKRSGVFPPPLPLPWLPLGCSRSRRRGCLKRRPIDVVIKDPGPKKIEVIKVIRQLVSLSLTEAKALAETADGKSLLQSAKTQPWTQEEAGRSRRCHRSQVIIDKHQPKSDLFQVAF